MKNNGRLLVFTLLLVVLATTCKFFFGPDLDWSGFSPIFAIALFAGLVINNKSKEAGRYSRDISFLVPLLALFISDVVIHILYTQNLFDYAGLYDGQVRNYLILLTATLIGWALKGRSIGSLLVGAIAAPTLFFLLSNFGVWLAAGEVVYARNFSGLMACYTAALPFYKNALVSTLVFLPGILLSYNYLVKNKAAITLAREI